MLWKTIVRRLLILIPQLMLLSIVVFHLAELMPGDALTGHFEADPHMSWEELQRLREAVGLDRHWTIRYVEWVQGMFRLDFGRSLLTQRPVTDMIGDRIWNTFRLSLVSTILTYMIAVPLGILSGKYKETILDRSIVTYTFVTMAMPTIIFAILMIWMFGFNLRWFPILGSVDPRLEAGTLAFHLSRLRHLMLPGLTGAILGNAFMINILRDRIIDAENSDYVTTARSKGVPRRVVYNRHILKNSALPLVAGFGGALVGLLGGSIFIERIFSFPGMGQLFVSAITTRDFPVANALVMIYGVLIVVGILLSDLFMMMLDPRIRIR